MKTIEIDKIARGLVNTVPLPQLGFSREIAIARLRSARELFFIAYLELAQKMAHEEGVFMISEIILDGPLKNRTSKHTDVNEGAHECLLRGVIDLGEIVSEEIPQEARRVYYLAWCAMFELTIHHVIVVPTPITARSGMFIDLDNYQMLVKDLEKETTVRGFDYGNVNNIFNKAHHVLSRLIMFIISNKENTVLH